jgi:hypothetical protein
MSSTALNLLLGPDAEAVLGAAISGHEARMDGCRPTDTRVQPSGAVRVTYQADVRRADGSRSREALVAATGESVPPGATVVAGQHCGEPVEVGVWRWLQDPALPALRIAADPILLAEALRAQGLIVSADAEIVVRAYRPAQRAVLEVRDRANRWFVKVVRPDAVTGLRVRHHLLGASLPVPPVVAHSAEGFVVLPAASGELLRELLGRKRPSVAAVPAPAELERVLDALPGDLMGLPGHRSILQRVGDSARVLSLCVQSDPAVPASLAAELVSEAARVRDGARSGLAGCSERPVPVHGDFYHGQLLTNGSRITALLDVDTAGPGERADEWANLIGYLSVLGLSHASARTYCDNVFAYAERRTCSGDLRRRTAAVVLGLATVPFRARLADWPERTADRIALAGDWLQRDERALICGSLPPHDRARS